MEKIIFCEKYFFLCHLLFWKLCKCKLEIIKHIWTANFSPRACFFYFYFEILLFRRALGAPTLQKVPDQTWNFELEKYAIYDLNMVKWAKCDYLKFLLIRIFIVMFVWINFLIFTFFSIRKISSYFWSRRAISAPA